MEVHGYWNKDSIDICEMCREYLLNIAGMLLKL